ncbi:hypothetical protein B0T13DRAFT_468085 [Neurospora crassa]|nr:hypothetical protein B0T13DRAFT_468085 [Neurospora crassa]
MQPSARPLPQSSHHYIAFFFFMLGCTWKPNVICSWCSSISMTSVAHAYPTVTVGNSSGRRDSPERTFSISICTLMGTCLHIMCTLRVCTLMDSSLTTFFQSM